MLEDHLVSKAMEVKDARTASSIRAFLMRMSHKSRDLFSSASSAVRPEEPEEIS